MRQITAYPCISKHSQLFYKLWVPRYYTIEFMEYWHALLCSGYKKCSNACNSEGGKTTEESKMWGEKSCYWQVFVKDSIR